MGRGQADDSHQVKGFYKSNVVYLSTLFSDRVRGSKGEEIGAINWFAVHGTSMYDLCLSVRIHLI